MSVHSHASGRQSTHSQATDSVIDLMNKVFDKVAGDAPAQRADADRREQQMQTRMDAEITRREREATEKAYLQMELAQLKKDIAPEKRQTAMQSFSPLPTTAQCDVQSDSMTPSSDSADSGRRSHADISRSSRTCVATADYRQREPLHCWYTCPVDCCHA